MALQLRSVVHVQCVAGAVAQAVVVVVVQGWQAQRVLTRWPSQAQRAQQVLIVAVASVQAERARGSCTKRTRSYVSDKSVP